MRATMITRRSAAARGDAQAARAARDSGARTLQARHRRPTGEGCPNLWRPDETSDPPASVSPTVRVHFGPRSRNHTLKGVI